MFYSNIFYTHEIKEISGITTFLYEIAKKYHELDITIMYDKDSNINQINKLKKYVRVIKVNPNMKYKCNKLFITYFVKQLHLFEANEIIGTIQTNFKTTGLQPYGSRVDKVVAVSQFVANTYEELCGVKPMVCYNVLTMKEQRRVLRLIYIGRLTDAKGKENIEILLKELEKKDIPYLLTIVSDGRLKDNPNVIYIPPRPNARNLIQGNDYLLQLTQNDDESYSYTINEALSMATPIIATDLSILKELGIKNKEHGYILNFDMTNIPIKDIYENIPKPTYTPPNDRWGEILDNTKAEYVKEQMIQLRCIRSYKDIEYNEHISKGQLYSTYKERAKDLVDKGFAEYEDEPIDPNCKYSVSVIIPVYNQEKLIIRTLDSIPARNNVEIIIIDDKSSDNTYKALLDYKKEHKDKNIILLHNMENKGVGYTFNRGLDKATGDYIVRIDSDDYFYTSQFNKMLDKELDGTDMIYYDLEDNTGRTLEVKLSNRKGRCGAVKFIRREFIEDTRCPEIRTAEDRAFNDELLEKQPTEKFTNRRVYHYNYPRENSLTDLTKRGLL